MSVLGGCRSAAARFHCSARLQPHRRKSSNYLVRRTMDRPTETRRKKLGAARHLSAVAPLALIAAAFTAPAAAPQSAPAASGTFRNFILPKVQRYCVPCHSGMNPPAGIDLSRFQSAAEVKARPGFWRRVLSQLRAGSMPPTGSPAPTPQERDQLAGWVQRVIPVAQLTDAPADPGYVLIHRLSREEYNNTIRDLLGVDTHPADSFPADGGGGGGFDNDAETLFVPPILMERYLQAASQSLSAADPHLLFGSSTGHANPKAEAQAVLRHFASLAYRRPVRPGELARLMQVFTAAFHRGLSWRKSVVAGLTAVLVSPNFLFRVEPTLPEHGAYRLNDYELASRLSYFLWSSMPDAELFRLAAANRLHQPATLQAQIDRMLASRKSRALGANFAGEWLRVRDLGTVAQPDPGMFPQFTPQLRSDMIAEAVDFSNHVLRRDASLLDFIGCGYTYLNQDMAQLYGVHGVRGAQFRRVALADGTRGGVITMAGVLAVTSYPLRTSPVLRGKWVLEQMLGAKIPPPPPNAGGLPATDAPLNGLSLRQRLEEHRKRPECASCHNKMDPIGFGLENFDPIGRWRTQIGGQPIDNSGVLAGGEKFAGPQQLKTLLLSQKAEFVRNMARRMLAYALGRGLQRYDRAAVNQIVQRVQEGGYRSGALIRAIVESVPFQFRTSNEQPPAVADGQNSHAKP
ncbi:MAG: DUF1592 domain-containing protein [Armatimonadetes bacterium]|nr:DUF1592 domain-containing protein [Armatimonadota bacterium]MDE2205855.1 DUF1592 domain-containing protein [Armatimonadota bacterium]